MNKVLLLSLASVGIGSALVGSMIVLPSSRNLSLTSTPSPTSTPVRPTSNVSPSAGSESGEPNDPYFYLQRPTFNLINSRKTLRESGGKGIIVAVIDTGVVFGDDLAPEKFSPGYDFLSGNGVPISKPEESKDSAGHGSFIAAIIAQSTNNGIGTVGLSPNDKIMPIRVLDATLHGDPAKLDKAIRYAVDHGADFISLSLADPSHHEQVLGAIDYAYRNNVVVIAASGNGYGKTEFYPAAYEEVLGVGSITQTDQIAPYSNSATIYAPGGFISTEPEAGKSSGCETPKIPQGAEPDPRLIGGIFQMVTVKTTAGRESRLMVCQGTSQATGFVTGVASAVKSIFKAEGIRSPKAVFQVILESARFVNGKRVLDADNSIQLAQLLTTPRTQLSESEQAKVDEFSERLKEEGGTQIQNGMRAMNLSRFKRTVVIYSDVDKLNKLSSSINVSGQDWNDICWDGMLIAGIKDEKKVIVEMMPACNKAVALSKVDEQDQYHQSLDSRGIARALAGDFAGSTRDFTEAIRGKWFDDRPDIKQQRQTWIQTLRMGQSPFTQKKLLISLQDPAQSHYYHFYTPTGTLKQSNSESP